MKIATTFKNDLISDHFGKTEYFKIYEIDNNKIVGSHVIDNNGLSHGSLVSLLVNENVNVLICGTIGTGAINILNDNNIKCVPGTFGNSDSVVNDYLLGNVCQKPNSIHECNHH